MRYFLSVILAFCSSLCAAQVWEDQRIFGAAEATQQLRILSSTDTSFLVPVIDAFLEDRPNLKIEYLVHGTSTIDLLYRQNPGDFDLVISSAMDLQLKLVNDGFGKQVDDIDLPKSAKWRDTLFAFTKEPAAIVLNRAAFPNGDLPKTRQDLITALRNQPDVFKDKIATYDVRTSGLGYLFATQDARSSETFWRLMEVMGGLGTRLYCCSGQMIDGLVLGDIAVAYNVLGSYAEARAKTEPALAVILPSDFPTTMMRTIFASDAAQTNLEAEAFIRFLIEQQRDDGRNITGLPSVMSFGTQQSIPLNPALLSYLDALKRRTFIEAWENALVQ